MKNKFKNIFSILLNALSAVYPVLFFLFLMLLNIPVRTFSLFILALAVFDFLFKYFNRDKDKKFDFSLLNPVFLLGIGVSCLIINDSIVLKFYPIFVNIVLIGTFGTTLLKPPTMIYRFAVLADKTIPKSLGEKKIIAYCYKVTVVWVVFFIANAVIASFIAVLGSDWLWVIYTTVGSGVLTGTLFVCEYIVRKIVQRKLPKAVPISAFNKRSRISSAVMCYEGKWSDGVYKTWKDFLTGTVILRNKIESSSSSNKWLLYCEDYWYFLLAFTALLQCKKEIILTANVSPSYITEIKEDVELITDVVFPVDNIYGKTFNIPEILSQKTNTKISKCPKINKDETSIIMFTSGSTGKPKKIVQRLTELENDNAFILSMWGEDIIERKIASTVNQHHIYGLLFSILLPFTAGVPFRRQIIRYPEEYTKLTDMEYTIVTVPAFLKRAVEVLSPNDLFLKSPYIFVSGGVLDPEIAKKTNETFGFWPLEIYGSTETSGIAWRQSKNGIEWTPFENAQLSQSDDGCLIVRSPYIKDPEGFRTSDTAEILEDGRFILKERIDSVVKIEEKRISLTEMEARIIQSGFASDAYVVPFKNTRQYLGAVIVLNDKGKEKFINSKKIEINNFWREYLLNYFEPVVIPKKWRYPDALPQDNQGKKKIDEIKLLFV